LVIVPALAVAAAGRRAGAGVRAAGLDVVDDFLERLEIFRYRAGRNLGLEERIAGEGRDADARARTGAVGNAVQELLVGLACKMDLVAKRVRNVLHDGDVPVAGGTEGRNGR